MLVGPCFSSAASFSFVFRDALWEQKPGSHDNFTIYCHTSLHPPSLPAMAETAAASIALAAGKYGYKFFKSRTTTAFVKRGTSDRSNIYQMVMEYGPEFTPKEMEETSSYLNELEEYRRDKYTRSEAQDFAKTAKKAKVKITRFSEFVEEERMREVTRLGSLHVEGYRSHEDLYDPHLLSPPNCHSRYSELSVPYGYTQNLTPSYPPPRTVYHHERPYAQDHHHCHHQEHQSSTPRHARMYTPEPVYEYEDEREPESEPEVYPCRYH
ncbi:hypothetical protein OF83DRAFT_718358 [Amylostereum chailletii]|nr:hypothetical protein OF83DRAFT_718358 [Amylostereum chailletii]